MNDRIILKQNYKILTLDNVPKLKEDLVFGGFSGNEQNKIFKHGVIGGTFDRLHTAHKLLLTELALRSESEITIGITDNDMIKGEIFFN